MKVSILHGSNGGVQRDMNKCKVCRLQAADFLFGAAAQPHDLLHEPLMRIFATGSLTAAAVSLALKVRTQHAARLASCGTLYFLHGGQHTPHVHADCPNKHGIKPSLSPQQSVGLLRKLRN